MRASRSRTREHTNLLTTTPDEAALAIACFLLTAKDLLSLRLACRRFGIKCIASGGGAAAARRRCCASWRRQRGGGWRDAASRSAAGCLGVASRAGWV